MTVSYDGQLFDVTDVDHLQIEIRADGAVIWLNTKEGCLVRVCQIGQLELVDNRPVSQGTFLGGECQQLTQLPLDFSSNTV